jgi:hypothetical protein
MTRFDLEQNILKCWNVTEDIDLLYRRIMDGPRMTEDEIANYLLGMSAIYNARFEETFHQFETLIQNKEL